MVIAGPLANISATAGLYSQLAGVLAGFAFTALLLYLSRTLGPEHRHAETARLQGAAIPSDDAVVGASSARESEGSRVDRQVTVVLLHTLGALILSALLYGVLAGFPPDSLNAFSGMLLNGPSFSLAILGMFYATALVASQFAHLAQMVSSARILLGAIGPVGAMVLIAPAALDIHLRGCLTAAGGDAARCPAAAQFAITRPYGYGIGLTALMLVITTAALTLQRNPTRPPAGWVPRAMALGIIGTAAGTVGGNAFLATKPVSYRLPDTALFAILSATFVLLTGFGLLAARSCHHFPAHPARPATARVDTPVGPPPAKASLSTAHDVADVVLPITSPDAPGPAIGASNNHEDADR